MFQGAAVACHGGQRAIVESTSVDSVEEARKGDVDNKTQPRMVWVLLIAALLFP
jgi:hypothetical protein